MVCEDRQRAFTEKFDKEGGAQMVDDFGARRELAPTFPETVIRSTNEGVLATATKTRRIVIGLPQVLLSGQELTIELPNISIGTTQSCPEMLYITLSFSDTSSGSLDFTSGEIGQDLVAPKIPEMQEVRNINDLQLRPKLAETLGYLYQGLSNKTIARKMNIAEYTARDYCSELYRKFDVAKRSELISQLARRGIAMTGPGSASD